MAFGKHMKISAGKPQGETQNPRSTSSPFDALCLLTYHITALTNGVWEPDRKFGD